MISAVIFDGGGVLIDNAAPGMFSHYASHLGVTEEQFRQVFPKYEIDWAKGKLTEDSFWEKITTDLRVKKPRVESLWLDGYLRAYKEKKEMFLLIKNLKHHGYKVALLTNTEIPIMLHTKKQSWTDFDLFVYSCEIGMRKPDREIYEYTLTNLSVAPDEAVFIDDREENVEAAQRLGMHSIGFESPSQVVCELQKMGLDFQLPK